MPSLILSVALLLIASIGAQGCPEFNYDALYDLQAGTTRTTMGVVDQVVPFTGTGCAKRGVLKINLASSGTEKRRALVDLFFQNSTQFSFNLGGSPTNNGYGGDASSTDQDAEIHSIGNTLLGYKSDVGGSGQAFSYGNFFSTRLTMIVGTNQLVLLPDDANKFNYYDKPGMFNIGANNDLYLGINKVIRGSRSGSGLCKVGIKLLDEL